MSRFTDQFGFESEARGNPNSRRPQSHTKPNNYDSFNDRRARPIPNRSGYPRRDSRGSYENRQTEQREDDDISMNSHGDRGDAEGASMQGRGGRGPRGRGIKEIKPMTYGRLKTWAESEDAGQLVLFMASERKQIETCLNQDNIKPDWFTLLVKAVSHAITAQHQKESIIQLLDVMCTSRFLDTHLTLYVMDRVENLTSAEQEFFFQSMISILNEILDKVPKHSSKCVFPAIQLSQTFTETGCTNQEIYESLRAISLRSKESHQKERKKQELSSKPASNFTRANQNEKPPDDFMDLDVVPMISDLKEDAKPFVRCAVTEGAYEDVKNYLDIQFRLMRQDFISPLQKGINEFRKNGCKKNFKCSDLRLYFDVHVIGTVFKDGIDHILQFDVSKMAGVKWEFSKRLIFGSLLCLSKDNFETVIFATVAHRDPAELKKGNISVSVKRGLDVVFNSSSSDSFIMAETTAYFESYCHVLEGLKEMVSHLPLQDYIISCKKEIKPPKYLLPSGGIQQLALYNLSCLLKNGDATQYPVLTTTRWPPAEAMCLNSSQRLAAISALTKEIAVIQGPPGTGKTYVGLKVMQVLIENQSVLPGNTENKNDPILVVCYTNHALEQFLEGVLEFCKDGIIRIGGKNKSEKLEKFNIKNLRLAFRKEKKFFDLSARNSRYECIRELEVIAEEIEQLNKKMDSLDIDIQTEDVLCEFMLDEHFDSLKNNGASSNSRRAQMRQWLNASAGNPEAVLPKMIKQHMTNLILKLPLTAWDGKINSRMDILQRSSIYWNILTNYRSHLYQLKQLSQNKHDQIEIDRLLELSNKKILSDKDLLSFMQPTLLSEIENYVKIDKKYTRSGMAIETWLLGTLKHLNNQLDDIQTLTDYLSGENTVTDTFDDFDAVKQVQDDRIDDDDNDDSENYSKKIKNAKDKFISVMKRAELLGIQEDILDDDDDGDDGGWKVASYAKPLSFGKIRQKITSTKPMTADEENAVGDIWKLDLNKRFALYNFWILKYKEKLTEKVTSLVERYESAYKRKEEASREETLALLKTCKVIGMTTTGAAKHRAVLQALGCRIIVVEEAAEVLESHIVTALNKNCNHLILIGDHQQLRPNPTVYELAKNYGLEISLFERLIKNKVPHVLLKEQHRMRPEISKIMRHIYKDLEDHPSVSKYESIRGVSKNIFFINHNEKELEVEDTRSKANQHEAEYLVALCNYLLNQGYQPSQITILATYTGQVFAIKKMMRGEKKMTEPDKKNAHVRVTAVDNFQGEENDIILLSLVRSNAMSNVGFLKVDNRVCVALSRAKKGLYIIGNFDILYKSSTLWRNIINEAKDDGFLGNSLEVVCPNHPDVKQNIKEPSDFKKCPEGGCGQPCSFRLPCGHVCVKQCHGYDIEHKEYVCKKPCPKSCNEGHRCKRKCHQDCGNCTEMVEKIMPICGHRDKVQCHLSPAKAVCSQRCESVLSCEHQCSGKCGQCFKDVKHAKCMTPVLHYWQCGHSSTVPCYTKATSNECQKVCDSLLECGHKCKGLCSQCLEGAIHISCKEPCDKLLPCGHRCKSTCGLPCSPCDEECPLQCRHALCSTPGSVKLCSHNCTQCIEKCDYRCGHRACSQLCSEPCDVKPCPEKCTRKVHICSPACGGRNNCRLKLQNCNHTCAGLCGEMCVCSHCEKISTINGMRPNTQNNTPATGEKDSLLIKIPSCRHIFKMSDLDEYVKSFDPNGARYIPCPVCSKPIMRCWRYESINKERNKKRAALKSELEKENSVSKNDSKKLIESQKKLTDPNMSSFHYIDTHAETSTEKSAISNQFKFAFVLSAVYSIVNESSDLFNLLKSRKDAIIRVGKKMSSQCCKEMSVELTRCLQLAYLTELESYVQLHGVIVPDNILMQLKDIRVQLGNIRPDKLVLDRSHAVIISLRRLVKDRLNVPVVQAKCQLMEERYDKAIQVLKSRDDQMLSDVLQPVALAAAAPATASPASIPGNLMSSKSAIQDEKLRSLLKRAQEEKLLKRRLELLTLSKEKGPMYDYRPSHTTQADFADTDSDDSTSS
ncbi:NFX1-type zinc finger-containing protein 1-like [Biomphalaria glabrata]|uniref:NFX1-type zinc finger-containing protein 1-like n=1 Tax=Biomphalaria glabrata TaxID=6526 RepID=A0A9W3AU36_BIOGL|nr:NFX1-type zinc finger-containing protein 1-like [Biomphalaria glabrata]XP_055890806.1 NFX1-type zinc finger-containing protein 1-like [Biomphalaria glabrata]